MAVILWVVVAICLIVWLLGAIIGFIGDHFWWFLVAALLIAAYNLFTRSRNVKN